MQKRMIALLSCSLMAASVASAGGAGSPPAIKTTAACQSIADIVASNPNFSTLLTALQAADLVETLKSGEYTVFAPTDAAFNKVPSDTLAGVLNDTEALKSVLLYHVVPGKVNAAQVMSMGSVTTVQGADLTISTSGSKVLVNGVNVVQADVPACNGVIHVIDGVLLPPVSASVPAPEPEPVAEAPVEPAPVEPAPVEPAPVEPAPEPVAEVPAPVPAPEPLVIPAVPLSQPSGSVPDTAPVAETPAPAQPAPVEPAPTADSSTSASNTCDATTGTPNTIYDLVVADDRFSTLRSLLSDAGLTETLMGGEYTVFAPTDDAFAAVDPGTLAAIASDPELLKQVLLYHVAPGILSAEQIATMTEIPSAEGQNLNVVADGGTVKVGNATVITPDVAACNGTIHIIDAVLIPPDLTLPAPTGEAGTTDTAADTNTETPAPDTATADTTATDTTTDTTTTEAPAPDTTTGDSAATTDTTTTDTTTTDTTTEAPAPDTATADTTATTPDATPQAVPETPAPTTDSSTEAGAGTLATQGNDTTNFNLTEVVATDPRFTTLAELLTEAGLIDTLKSGVYTVFAPTNDAFAKLDPGTLAALKADPEKLKQVLLYHVVDGFDTAASASGEVASLDSASDTLKVSGEAGAYTVNDVSISQPDVETANGIIHVVDTVLIPPSN
ncbi:fasciclin domain-containing protein [Deinococcus sp.]|uniref:fasciclin domain-containing protein n=1 Tax=Deinococcus sp. TaxID=47478 RepID=UPI003B598F20